MNLQETESTFTIRDMLGVLRQHWVVPVAGGILALCVGAAMAFFSTPIYRAEVVAVPVPDQEARGSLSALVDQLGGATALTRLTLGGGSRDAQGIAILRSRALVGELIRDEKLLPVLYRAR